MPLFYKFVFILFVATQAMGQDSLTFEIKTKLFKLGDLNITKTTSQTGDTVNYKLKSTVLGYSFYTIDYLMESEFVSGVLKNSLSSIIVNGNPHHYCTTTQTKTGYVVHSLDGELTHTQPITSGITPLYFGEKIVADSVFSEYSGRYRPFVIKNDSTYILDPESPMEFVFSKGKIKRIIVPNVIMDFYVVLIDD